MTRSHLTRLRAVTGSLAIAATLALAGGVANAALTIGNASPADEKTISDLGGCRTGGGCIPLGVTGYIVDNAAPSLIAAAGTYKFTYPGAGDSENDNAFVIPGGGIFCSQSFVACNGGAASVIGDSFTMTLGAGAIPFVFTASRDAGPNGGTGCVLKDGSTTNAQSHSGCADYFIALGQSTVIPGLTSPGERFAYIGLTDLPFPGDHDFQDLSVKVEQIPEPGTLAIIGAGLMGIGTWWRRGAPR